MYIKELTQFEGKDEIIGQIVYAQTCTLLYSQFVKWMEYRFVVCLCTLFTLTILKRQRLLFYCVFTLVEDLLIE